MIALDTNLLVRLITADDATQAAAVSRYLAKHATAASPAYVDCVVLCELAWVLERSYAYSRDEVCTALDAVMAQPSLRIDAIAQAAKALDLYRIGPADFSDYLIAVRARDAGYAPTVTLDKRAAKSKLHTLMT